MHALHDQSQAAKAGTYLRVTTLNVLEVLFPKKIKSVPESGFPSQTETVEDRQNMSLGHHDSMRKLIEVNHLESIMKTINGAL